jgi:hypothetical protein
VDSENRRVLQFRCANTGRRFIVIFNRSQPDERFRVMTVIDEKDLTGQEMPAAAWKPPKPKVSGRLESGMPGLMENARNLLLPLLGKSLTTQKMTHSEEKPHVPEPQAYDMNEFDFTGWYCPCCGHGKGPGIRFVRCARCREYICGGRITRVEGGQLFKCHDGCGNSGILGGGTISSMSGIDFNMPKVHQLEGGKKALPAPPPRLKSGGDS